MMNAQQVTEVCPATRPRRFYDCTFNEKLLYTSFLLLIGFAYLMALTYLYTGFAGIDGKPGLSVDDIAENYYGNRSGTRLESALRGAMASHIDITQRHHIIEWLKSGASERGYNDKIRPILAERCFGCHSAASGLAIPDFTSYAGIKPVANVDTGVSLHSLMKVSHIHLFGIGLVALGVGLIFRFSVLPSWFQNTLTVLPFIAIFSDIFAWFFTKWDPHYAYVVVVSGAVLGVSWAAQIGISIYQAWFLRCHLPPGDGNLDL